MSSKHGCMGRWLLLLSGWWVWVWVGCLVCVGSLHPTRTRTRTHGVCRYDWKKVLEGLKRKAAFKDGRGGDLNWIAIGVR